MISYDEFMFAVLFSIPVGLILSLIFLLLRFVFGKLFKQRN